MIHRLFRPRFADDRNESIWLTIYADLITNLMLLFLALFGLMVMGEKAVSDALMSMKLDDVSIFNEDIKVTQIEKTAQKLREEYKNNPDINILEEAGALRITFGENVLFESGRDQLKTTAAPALSQAYEILKKSGYSIIVEGHTDSVPIIPGARFKNNWELSLARAMSVVRLLIDNGNFPPDQLAAAAYGSYRPRANNITESGRRINRRVEIALFEDFPINKEESKGIQP